MPELLAAFQQRGVEVTADKIERSDLLLSGVLTYAQQRDARRQGGRGEVRYPWSSDPTPRAVRFVSVGWSPPLAAPVG